jgi:hypothetical protein
LNLKLPRRWELIFDLFVLFLFAAVLIKPLFHAGYLDKWGSIESSLIADARFLIDHWPHPKWQPLWYAGTRFDYVYGPVVRYATAIVAKTTGFWPVTAYHFLISVFYCVGIAGVYLFVRTCGRSRGMAWLAAISTALLSPSFLFLEPVRLDAYMLLPARLGVMVKYGEGPHMTALALIPIVLACVWRALESFRPAWIGLAAIGGAVVISTDFSGATALVTFYCILVWSLWITHQDKRIVKPAVAMIGLSFGLTSFWLVPSNLVISAQNMKFLGTHGTTWSIWFTVAIAIAYALLSDRFAIGRPERAWAVFTTGCALFFSLNVLANFYLKFRIAGEPIRLVPELDLAIILFGATLLHFMWNRPGTGLRWLSGVVVLLSFCTTVGYIHHAWEMFPRWPDYRNRIEYQVSEWLWSNMRDARVMASGSVRFWLDAWHDLPQLGGGSDSAILDPTIEQSRWELKLGASTETSVLWLQCLGIDAVYAADARSQEAFKETAYPQKYDGVLPVLFDNQAGDRLFRVPRRYAARARVVDTARLNATRPPRGNVDVERLRAYAAVIENGPDVPVTVAREGTDAMTVQASFAPGQSLVVQESYDPAWQAFAGRTRVPVREDAMGFMALDPPAGTREVRLRFTTPFENYVGWMVTCLCAAIVGAVLARGIREARPA